MEKEERNKKELHRRTLVKSLLWRIIGIAWTWIGAYIILLFVPPSKQAAAFIATLIVIYHHSTRMIMYYAYERIWVSIKWGRGSKPSPMSFREKMLWVALIAAGLALIFFLLLHVHPKIKGKQSARVGADFLESLGYSVAPIEVKDLESSVALDKCSHIYALKR